MKLHDGEYRYQGENNMNADRYQVVVLSLEQSMSSVKVKVTFLYDDVSNKNYFIPLYASFFSILRFFSNHNHANTYVKFVQIQNIRNYNYFRFFM